MIPRKIKGKQIESDVYWAFIYTSASVAVNGPINSSIRRPNKCRSRIIRALALFPSIYVYAVCFSLARAEFSVSFGEVALGAPRRNDARCCENSARPTLPLVIPLHLFRKAACREKEFHIRNSVSLYFARYNDEFFPDGVLYMPRYISRFFSLASYKAADILGIFI